MRARPAPGVAVITGASAGVGRATARLLARRGMRLALLARGGTGLRAAAEDVRANGGVALPIETDVSDHSQVEAAADRATSELGPIDLWVNDAFASVFAPFSEIGPEEFRRVTEVCYLGYVYGTQAALRRMVPRGPAPSCRWDPHWRTGRFRYSPPIVALNTRSSASPSRYAVNFCTIAVRCA
ncbi:NAD(P)-dependent dehydrogenase (short-subunit alcohol dehydrogenase family) [Plantactinospora soyae]|uniref:NAD(P)-dependent dehydrogenase (Short-subunit alcohol dehydrogenase family) n=1 Tax=Plantactinospora soyae TaxID=1544732 RepID=A0A927R3Y6_9ACTN|nr:NAD(P)-dependent dehydrogenase (short-subunit alcohol dehydrogenase family) [Plantactinospora soyae]